MFNRMSTSSTASKGKNDDINLLNHGNSNRMSNSSNSSSAMGRLSNYLGRSSNQPKTNPLSESLTRISVGSFSGNARNSLGRYSQHQSFSSASSSSSTSSQSSSASMSGGTQSATALAIATASISMQQQGPGSSPSARRNTEVILKNARNSDGQLFRDTNTAIDGGGFISGPTAAAAITSQLHVNQDSSRSRSYDSRSSRATSNNR